MLWDKKWGKELEVQTEPWRKALNDAADYIEKHDWRQGALVDIDGKVCALGAIVFSGHYDDAEAREALKKYLSGTPWVSIAEWNDAPGRTKEEVIAAFRNAARG